jgi:ABC-2 type transport system permease protein
MPQLLQQISLATPHAWALMAYDEVLAAHGPNLLRVVTNCAVLFTFAAACFVTGVWRFSRVSAEDLVPR